MTSDQSLDQSAWRRRARALLVKSIEQHLGSSALVRANQALYWDPTDPKGYLVPDVALRRNTPSDRSLVWNTWARGAPHVAVELVSNEDQPELPLEEQLRRYQRAGVAEVVRFDRDDPNTPIRLWDFLDGDLVERDPVSLDARFCDALELYWCVQNHPELGAVLGLAQSESGEPVEPAL